MCFVICKNHLKKGKERVNMVNAFGMCIVEV